MSVTPEHVEQLAAGITPYQIILLIFLGIIIFIGFINIVKWMMEKEMGTIPEDIKNLNEDIKNLNTSISSKLSELEKAIIETRAKLWTKEDIAKEIQSAINQHVLDCPLRNKDK